jgi:hypothetical protein
MNNILNINPNKDQYEALGFYVILLVIVSSLLALAVFSGSSGLKLSLLPIILFSSVKPIYKMKKNRFLKYYL